MNLFKLQLHTNFRASLHQYVSDYRRRNLSKGGLIFTRTLLLGEGLLESIDDVQNARLDPGTFTVGFGAGESFISSEAVEMSEEA